ncbi:hypothetical protein GGS21DRAFT_526491 [Xylaria nigripes]|nr:hypothetical protein GGS21DRAFT_526491 [Xylaria nigripes]
MESQNPRHDDAAGIAYELDTDPSIDFDEATGTATFPSGMRYSVRDLDSRTRDAVVQALSPSSKLAIHGFSPRGQGYVFLLSETVEYHVTTPTSDPHGSPYHGPRCSCQQGEERDDRQLPCRHTLWLCDQVLSQMAPLPEDYYTWTTDGYTAEHGNVCDRIPDYQLDVLADSLQCDIMAGEMSKTRPGRIRTAREILATLSGVPVKEYRPDLTGQNVGRGVVKEGDLEETIFRMLLQNESLLSYFMVSMRNHGPLNPRFRRFRDRADAALEAFDDYIKASSLQKAELSKNPQWCRMTLRNILDLIRSIITQSERELDEFDSRAAASTLVYMLEQVVARNEDHEGAMRQEHSSVGQSGGQPSYANTNLFNDFLVETNDNFILNVLEELQPEFVAHTLPNLCLIEQLIARTDSAKAFRKKLSRMIVELCRTRPISRPNLAAMLDGQLRSGQA